MNKKESSDQLPYPEWKRRVSEWLVHYATIPLDAWKIRGLEVFHRQGLTPQDAAQQIVRAG